MNRQIFTLTLCTIICCIIMFAAGLKPKGFRLYNTVTWLEQTKGISFGKIGIAFTDDKIQLPCYDSISVEIALKHPAQKSKHLAVIFDMWNSSSKSHTVLCQWDSSLMVMKSHSRYFKNSRLHIGKSVTPDKPCFITITSSRDKGTDLHINGILERSTNRFVLCDGNETLGSLILGNSADASNPWKGEIYFFSLHRTVLSKDRIMERYRIWEDNHDLPSDETTIALYSFDERNGTIAHDRSGKTGDLIVPRLLSIPQKRILSMPWEDFQFDKSTAIDIAMNFFGFIPFGFLFTALLYSLGGKTRRYRLLVCVIAGTGISLFFELTQAYIPTRWSQVSDVFLNTLGTMAGAIIHYKSSRKNIYK